MADFKFLLPTMGELSYDQRRALTNSDPVMVTGGPGSGKTVVSIHRLIRYLTTGHNVLLFTYNRTLMAAIRSVSEELGLSHEPIQSFFDWYYQQTGGMIFRDDEETIAKNLASLAEAQKAKYDEVLIDEAQDLEPKIIRNLHYLANRVSCGADKDQNIKQHYANAEKEIYAILEGYEKIQHEMLTVNYRNSKQVFQFARALTPENPRPFLVDVDDLPEGNLPELLFGRDINQQMQLVLRICLSNRNENIGILVHRKDEVDRLRSFLSELGIVCSYYYNGMSKGDQKTTEDTLQSPFITTFASCKGLQFDVVILPFFDTIEEFIGRWTEANLYYIAATRTRRQLFVLGHTLPAIIRNMPNNIYVSTTS